MSQNGLPKVLKEQQIAGVFNLYDERNNAELALVYFGEIVVMGDKILSQRWNKRILQDNSDEKCCLHGWLLFEQVGGKSRRVKKRVRGKQDKRTIPRQTTRYANEQHKINMNDLHQPYISQLCMSL